MLRHDKDLDMLITEPRPGQIAPYYQSPDYISHTDASKTFTDRIYQLVKRYMLRKKVRIIERYTNVPGKVLDIGAGTGGFLHTALSRNWTVEGVEPHPSARQRALEKGLNLYSSLELLPRATYDAITLWHTLEHLPDLDQHIKTFAQILNPEGVILVAVPNFRSLDAKIYKEFWAGYDVPRHLWHFSQTAIQTLFEQHELKVINRIPLVFDAFYIALLSERYKTKRNRYVRAFFNGLHSNIAAWHTSEYSSLLYVIKKA